MDHTFREKVQPRSELHAQELVGRDGQERGRKRGKATDPALVKPPPFFAIIGGPFFIGASRPCLQVGRACGRLALGAVCS